MTLSEILTAKYLLDPTPPHESRLYLPLLVFFALIVIVAIIIKIASRTADVIKNRFYLAFITCGVLGLVYLFGRYERLPWLGSRIYLLLDMTVLMVWTVINFVSAARFYPQFNKEKKLQERYEKYLPKPKNMKHEA